VAKNSAEHQSDFQTPLSWGPAVLPILGSWNLIAAWRTWQTEARTCPLVQNFLLRVLGEGCEAPKKCHLVDSVDHQHDSHDQLIFQISKGKSLLGHVRSEMIWGNHPSKLADSHSQLLRA
jgi:hypothetical protein